MRQLRVKFIEKQLRRRPVAMIVDPETGEQLFCGAVPKSLIVEIDRPIKEKLVAHVHCRGCQPIEYLGFRGSCTARLRPMKKHEMSKRFIFFLFFLAISAAAYMRSE